MDSIFLFKNKNTLLNFINQDLFKDKPSNIICIFQDTNIEDRIIASLYTKDINDKFITRKELFSHQNKKLFDFIESQCTTGKYIPLSTEKFWTYINHRISININELTEMLDIISILNKNYIYRGLSKVSYNLSPSLTRNNLLKENDKIERLIFDDITEFNLKIFKSKKFIEIASNMQHFGFPTRLMDWSTSPLHALYFACYSTSNTEDAKVICLNKDNLYKEKDSNDNKSLINEFLKSRYTSQISNVLYEKLYNLIFFKRKNVVYINPANYNDRLKNQLGVFTLHIDVNFSEFKKLFNQYIKKNIHKLEPQINLSTLKEISENILFSKEFKNTEDLPSKLTQLKAILIKQIELTNTHASMRKSDSAGIPKKLNSFFYDLEFLVSTTNPNLDHINSINFLEFIIPKDKKIEFIKQLNLFGINSKTVYPDVEGYSQYIQEKYFTYKEALNNERFN